MESSSMVLQNRINKFIPLSVIHIGAATCEEWNDYIKLGVRKVLWIDGNKNLLKIGMDIIKKRNITNQTSLNVYLSHENGIETLYETSNIGGIAGRDDSLLKPFNIGISTNSMVEVNVRRLDSLFSELNIDASDYNTLVIDVQGAELKVLAGCGNIINHMNFVLCETWKAKDDKKYKGEHYKDESNVNEVKCFMEKIYKFKETSRYEISKISTWMDILFEKPEDDYLC